MCMAVDKIGIHALRGMGQAFKKITSNGNDVDANGSCYSWMVIVGK